MALTKISRTLLDTGVSDSSDATAITIDSSEKVGIGETSPDRILHVKKSDAAGTVAKFENSAGTVFIELNTNNQAGGDAGYIAYNSTKDMTFLTDDTERARIDSAGKLGIGTSSPSYKLHVNSGVDGISAGIAGNTYGIRFDNGGSFSSGMSTIHGVDDTLTGSYQPIMLNGSDVRFGTSATERMRINSSGHVGIGTNSPTTYSLSGTHVELLASTANEYTFFHVNTNSVKSFLATNDSLGLTALFTYSSHPLTLGTGNSEKVRIDTSGNLLVGKTSDSNTANGVTLRPDGNARFTTAGTGSALQLAFFRNGSASEVGSISTTSSATAFNTSSDYRLKENVDYTWDATTRLKQLKPARFNFIADETNTLVDGFLAHEVSSVVPEAITGEKDGDKMQGIDHSKLVPLLTKAIQEQQTIIEDLESRIKTLEG